MARRIVHQHLIAHKHLSDYEAHAETSLLFEHILQQNDTWQRTYPDHVLSDEAIARLTAAVAKRVIEHQPAQYITGQANFMGRWYTVTPDVLIPREDTSHLVTGALHRAEQLATTTTQPLNIMDIGTGSGCIAITLALELKRRNIPVEITAIDISQPALSIAERNAQTHGAHTNIRFVQGDIFTYQPDELSPYHLLVSNPPYIDAPTYAELMDDVRLHEPKQALVADNDGLVFYQQLASLTPQRCWLLAEFGLNNSGSQQQAIANLLPPTHWRHVTFHKDDANIPRWFEGEKFEGEKTAQLTP